MWNLQKVHQRLQLPSSLKRTWEFINAGQHHHYHYPLLIFILIIIISSSILISIISIIIRITDKIQVSLNSGSTSQETLPYQKTTLLRQEVFWISNCSSATAKKKMWYHRFNIIFSAPALVSILERPASGEVCQLKINFPEVPLHFPEKINWNS